MFRITALLKFLFFFLLIAGEVSPTRVADSAHLRRSQLEPRQARQHLTIIKGLLRSKNKNIVKVISEIPCNVIQIIDNDIDAAKDFVEQLLKGETPSLIKDIPDDIVRTLTDVISIFETLPSQIVDVAEAAVTDVAKVFDHIGSGEIKKDLESLPDVIASDIIDGWGEFTSGLKKGWDEFLGNVKCKVVDCPSSDTDAHICGLSDTPDAAPTASAPETAIPTPPPSNNISYSGSSPSAAPTQFEDGSGGTQLISHLSVLHLCCIAATSVLGVALLL